MNTSDLIKVLQDNRQIQKVSLSKITNAQEFWLTLTHDMYMNLEYPIDEQVRDSMNSFAEKDTLDLVNKQGRILKRYAKHFKECTGTKLSDELAGKIGDKLQYYINLESTEYFVDFTDSIDWRDGQFGKSDSCWFGRYSKSVPSFENAGGWGIRYYRSLDQNNDNGCGRTWIYPKNGMLMCFNSYGIASRPRVSKTIKQVFKNAGITLHYKAVELYNSNHDDIPYINSGTGFILFPDGVDENTLEDRYDVDIEVESDDSDVCYGCGRRIAEGDGFYTNDEMWCESCHSDRFSYCERCDEYHESNDVHEVHDHSRYNYLCEYCIQREEIHECYNCEEYHVDGVIDEDNDFYCESCAEDKLTLCEECDVYSTNEHNHESDNEDSEADQTESTESDIPEYDFIAGKLETVQYKNSNGIQIETKTVYRHAHASGLYLAINSQDRGEFWSITHERSGLSVSGNISEQFKAFELLNRIAGLTNWNQDGESITSNRPLCDEVMRIRREIL